MVCGCFHSAGTAVAALHADTILKRSSAGLFGADTNQKIFIAVLSFLLSLAGSDALAERRRKQDPHKRLSYDTTIRKGLLGIEDSIREKVSILYGGHEARDLHYATCTVQNTGNTVVKNQTFRFQFTSNILDHYLDPVPEAEIGVEPLAEPPPGPNQVRYGVRHLEKRQSVDFRFVLEGESSPMKIHPFNDAGDVEVTPRAVGVAEDNTFHLRRFIWLGLLLAILPRIFDGAIGYLGSLGAGAVRIVLLALMLPHIPAVIQIVSNLVVRLTQPRVERASIQVTGGTVHFEMHAEHEGEAI